MKRKTLNQIKVELQKVKSRDINILKSIKGEISMNTKKVKNKKHYTRKIKHKKNDYYNKNI